MTLKGKIIILSGPSGSGKTTLYHRLLCNKSFKNVLVRTVSVTTRARREGEVNGRDYYFISDQMFRYKIRAGHFLEFEKVFDHYYGTPAKQVRRILNQGKNVLLCIDVKGAKTVSSKHPQTVKIFIKTPTLKILSERLKARGSEQKKALDVRLKTAREELKEEKNYHYVIVNDQLEASYQQLKDIILSVLSENK